MLGGGAARNYAKESGNQCVFDGQCFAWSPILHLAKSHVDKKSLYSDYTTVLNLEGIEFLVTLKQITKFELLMIYLSYLPSERKVRKKMLVT